MTYEEKRNQRKELAQERIKRSMDVYGKETLYSINNSEIIKFKNIEFPIVHEVPKMIVEELGSTDSILAHAGNSKTAVLNFASFKHPGGGFINGTHAQEECLCYDSNLYNVLETFTNTFYIPNREDSNKSLYHSRGIYSKDIIFEKNNKKVKCDVITIASPNRGSYLENYKGIEENNLIALEERLEFVLETAALHGIKTLILGAFGCGVFKQDPIVVATIFKTLLKTFDYNFDTVYFAIPGGNKSQANLDAFKKVIIKK